MNSGVLPITYSPMKKASLLLLLPLLACSTPYARQWESRLWHTPAVKDGEMLEVGELNTDELHITVFCTQFRQVLNPNNSVISIGVQCLNTTDTTYLLEFNPVQVVSDSNLIVQPLPLDHVMYKFYGGDLRSAAQLARISQPYADYTGTVVDDILTAVVNVYRAYENQAIITEFARKEALPHDLYYRSFTPTSLPPGVAVQWIQYYPGTPNPIKVMIEGKTVESAVTFEKPPPAPAPKPRRSVGVKLLVMLAFAAIVVASIVEN